MMLIRHVQLLAFAIALILSWTPAFADEPYRAPRTPEGHPDLQGVWINSSLTPFERPDYIKTLLISGAEAARIVDIHVRRSEDRTKPTEASEWLDQRQLEPIRGQLRSSIIVDPENGKIPSNETHKEHVRLYRMSDSLGFDGPEQRPLDERCLVGTAVPPLRATSSNNLHQIIQAAGAGVVVIHSEDFHDARIIRLNSTHRPAAAVSWLGDSIGWWDGETLVVETKYFLSSRFVSSRATVVERFTRHSANEIDYVFTVEDPSLYTQTWRGESHLLGSEGRIFESACHEGNYSLSAILQGARARTRPRASTQALTVLSLAIHWLGTAVMVSELAWCFDSMVLFGRDLGPRLSLPPTTRRIAAAARCQHMGTARDRQRKPHEGAARAQWLFDARLSQDQVVANAVPSAGS